MRQIFLFDEYNLFIGEQIISKDCAIPINSTNIQPVNGLYRPKWTGVKWIEGATKEEIDRITKVEPAPPSEAELTLELLKKQNQALSKINSELSSKNSELKNAVALHGGIISELVMKMYEKEMEEFL